MPQKVKKDRDTRLFKDWWYEKKSYEELAEIYRFNRNSNRAGQIIRKYLVLWGLDKSRRGTKIKV